MKRAQTPATPNPRQSHQDTRERQAEQAAVRHTTVKTTKRTGHIHPARSNA